MRYVICGYPPGEGGVPKLIEYIDNNKTENILLIHPFSLKTGFTFPDLLLKALFRLIFSARCLFIRNKKICLIHQQSIGLALTKFLITHNRTDPIIYFMDNSFFCLSSYNLRKDATSNFMKSECLKCLKGDFENAIIDGCKSITFSISNERQIIKFLKWLREYKGKLRFLSLSKTNKSLMEKHFETERVEKIYFLTEDLKPVKIIEDNIPDKSYDFVFHGSAIDAKGLKYFIELAKFMPKQTFFVPSEMNSLEIPSNLKSRDMRWESGLKEIVQSAKIVFTPSLWSYTPEAASLKSFYYNGVVAMMCTDFGFNNEIPSNAYIKLTGNIEIDKKALLNLSSLELENIRSHGKDFFRNYSEVAERDMKDFLDNNV